MIGISACLLGICCTYKNCHNIAQKYTSKISRNIFIPICPEQLGGLCTPRPPSEIIGGNGFDVLNGNARVFSDEGRDVTKEFIQGAESALYILKLYNIKNVILKERSPSCGVNNVYDGTFTRTKIDGPGVASALFIKNGLHVYNEIDECNFIK